MPCYRPLEAYKKAQLSKNGKAQIVFKKSDAGPGSEMLKLPCGRCVGCRIRRSKDWALRCVHEASLYTFNCFITLTFSEENLNEHGTLVKADFQRFMKRLRRKFEGLDLVEKVEYDEFNDKVVKRDIYPIRFFHCGEYGNEYNRPHHHACIFNFDFLDKYEWSNKGGNVLYRSDSLEKLWPFGFCTIGEVNYKTAAYVARYVTKKVYGEKAEKHYTRINTETGEIYKIEPEYVTMSRRPGIAANWFKEYTEDIYSKDFITHEGKEFFPPKYYDKLHEEYALPYQEDIQDIKERRSIKQSESELNDPKRRSHVEKCSELKLRSQKRRLENVN